MYFTDSFVIAGFVIYYYKIYSHSFIYFNSWSLNYKPAQSEHTTVTKWEFHKQGAKCMEFPGVIKKKHVEIPGVN